MTVTIRLPALFPEQQEVYGHPAQFRVLACGRRSGKSYLLSTWLAEGSLAGERCWWVWPTFPSSAPGWRMVRTFAESVRAALPQVQIREADRMVIMPGGGSIQIKTAEDPGKLVGESLDRLAVDECYIIQERAWEESLRPTLIDRGGRAILAGVPKGYTWGHRLWLLGQDPANEATWKSWNFSTFANPHLNPQSLQDLRDQYARREITELVWRQEILGEFVSHSGQVFRRVTEAATAPWQDEPTAGHRYVFGVDWGQAHDYTAIAVWDLTDQALVHLDRFRQVDYAIQLERLRALYERFRPVEIIAEKNSMGGPLVERIAQMDLPIRAFDTTNSTKDAAIRGLALAIETGEARLVADPVLIGELQSYEASKTATGRPKYSAPKGGHDDCVMAAAIGYTGAQTREMGMIVL